MLLVIYTMTSRRIWPEKVDHTIELAGKFDSLERFDFFKKSEEERLKLDKPIEILRSWPA